MNLLGAAGPGPCSELSALHGLPLIGTAGCYDAVLAFELAPPWTPRLAGSRASDAALDAAIARTGRESKRVRLLALEPDGEPDRARILWFTRQPGSFERFERREYIALRRDLGASIERLTLTGSLAEGRVEVADAARDILVCTHGARDACCGRFGYPLFVRFSQLARRHSDVRVWRTSHLGGHRFAPTLIDLPSGRLFGRLGGDDAEAVLDGGSALLSRVETIYRGRCALPEAAQIVERRLWLEIGESIENATLAWQVEPSGDRWNVRLEAICDGGRRHAVQAVVERAASHAITTPTSCGRDPESEAPWNLVA
ncbi:MAG TPA: sucrase ferredoxin [Candidatus Binatia bacterium]|jgi:hypothetical protein